MRHKFFAAPSFGGKLAILNAVSWGILAVSLRIFDSEIDSALLPAISGLFIAVALCLAFPLALLLVMPSTGGPSLEGVIFSAIAIGINSFVWGYGLAYLSQKSVLMRPLSKRFRLTVLWIAFAGICFVLFLSN